MGQAWALACLMFLSSARESRAFHVPMPVPSPMTVLHVFGKVGSVGADIGDRAGQDLVLHPLGAVVTHVPVAGPLAKGVLTKVVVPGGQLAIHGVVTTDNLAGHAISGGEKVAAITVAVGKPVASGVTWAAGSAGLGVIDLRFMTAQTTLAGVNQAEKAGRVVAAVQAVGGYASQTMADISQARLGHAAQDLTELIASELAVASENKLQQTQTALSDAGSALAANLEAINCLRRGQWIGATTAMGRGMVSAGGAMTVAGHAEMGFAITQGGHAIEVEAPNAAHLAQVMARIRANHSPGEIIPVQADPKGEALALSQAAVNSARAGRLQEATLRATMAVALVSATVRTPGDKSGDAAVLWAQSALADAQAGHYGIASANAGDALSAAGRAIGGSDSPAGWALVQAGANLHQYAQCSNAVKSDVAAVGESQVIVQVQR